MLKVQSEKTGPSCYEILLLLFCLELDDHDWLVESWVVLSSDSLKHHVRIAEFQILTILRSFWFGRFLFFVIFIFGS